MSIINFDKRYCTDSVEKRIIKIPDLYVNFLVVLWSMQFTNEHRTF